MKRSGFTLIELLVVIAIIAILAAILFPVFARARAKAMQTDCLSNVKQIALSALMYASDNDDKFPAYFGGTAQGCSNEAAWALDVLPYIKNTQIFVCPSAGGNPAPTCGTTITILDYAMNQDIMSSNAPTSNIAAPASCLAITEGSRGMNSMSFSYGDWSYIVPNNPGWFPADETPCYDRHNGGANYGFVDGHAKWLTVQMVGNTSTTGPFGAGPYAAWFSPTGT